MNLKAIVTAISLIPELLGLVDDTVKGVETSLAGFTGSQKLAAAEAKINSFLTAAIQDVAVLGQIQPILTALINGAVAAFNAAGLFTKSTAAPAA